MIVTWIWIACSSAPQAPPARPAALVAVTSVREGSLDDTWSYLGEVSALERAELAAGAAGALVAVTRREGEAVTAGELIAEVDPKLALAELEVARARADQIRAEQEQARRTLARVGKVRSGVLAPNEVEAAEADVARLDAALEAATADRHVAWAKLERHRVRAPFDGVVARRHVDPGDWVNPGTSVVDVVSTGATEVRVDAPLQLARQIEPGQAVELQLKPPVEAKVVGVVPALDPVSRTAVVRIVPPPEASGLVAGTAVPVAFSIQHDGGLVIPRDAIVVGATEERVFKIVEGAAQPIAVRRVASSAERVLVEADGLATDDVIVVRGNERLRPGQPVRVEP
ncbi:MAG: efflux RND transporter periplasmic adaptor subunit [Myxococcota bacterium]